ncbi:hypothetical protein [Streptomyces sasae]|uniref:hypothetical protein n=1 Tax=Streptomyces sasae TaxID=1266772 RepID=UPI00292F2581|nr:hypothetical protein [Streptomyces sasae]
MSDPTRRLRADRENDGALTAIGRKSPYILIMTDAYNVSPAISSTSPTDAEVAARLALLAADRAGIITSDWSTKSAAVLSAVSARS